MTGKIFKRAGRIDLTGRCYRAPFLRWGGRSGALTQHCCRPRTTQLHRHPGQGISMLGKQPSRHSTPMLSRDFGVYFRTPCLPFDLPLSKRRDWLPWVAKVVGGGGGGVAAAPAYAPLVPPIGQVTAHWGFPCSPMSQASVHSQKLSYELWIC